MIALALGGRTVAEWKAAMSHAEFLSWVDFYEAEPFDDFHRFHRPAALIAQSLGGGDVAEKLAWLRPEPVQAEPGDEKLSAADLNTLKAFGLRK